MKTLKYLSVLLCLFSFSSAALASVLVAVPIYSVTIYEDVRGRVGSYPPPEIYTITLSVSKLASSDLTEIEWLTSYRGMRAGAVTVNADGDFEISFDRSTRYFGFGGHLKGTLQGNTIAVREFRKIEVSDISMTKKIVQSSGSSDRVQISP